MAAPEYAPGLFDCRFRRLGRAGYGRIGLDGQEGVLFLRQEGVLFLRKVDECPGKIYNEF